MFFSITTYLVTNNRELWIVSNNLRNGSLWSNVHMYTFWERGHKIAQILRLQAWSLLLGIWWKHTNLCNKGVFSFTFLMQCRWPHDDDQMMTKVFKGLLFYILCIGLWCGNTKWECWSLRITKGVQCLYRETRFTWLRGLVAMNTAGQWMYMELRTWSSKSICNRLLLNANG